jgi:hypothetical protein
MKILTPRVHGYIDYAIVVLFLLAPTLFAFGGLPATICYVLAVVHLGLSLLTAYPLGLVKAIPFPLHGGLELAVGVFLIASPWIFGFQRDFNARLFYIITGAAVGAVWLVTRYQTTPAEAGRATLDTTP